MLSFDSLKSLFCLENNIFKYIHGAIWKTFLWILNFYLFIFCNLFIFFLQQHNTVLRIHYLQTLNLQKALQYVQYITYSNLQYTLQ